MLYDKHIKRQLLLYKKLKPRLDRNLTFQNKSEYTRR